MQIEKTSPIKKQPNKLIKKTAEGKEEGKNLLMINEI